MAQERAKGRVQLQPVDISKRRLSVRQQADFPLVNGRDFTIDIKGNKHIKTVDTREMKRPLEPFLEQISTLHLDMLAQQQGLEDGVPLWFLT